jgi:hypothetical protein
MTCCICLFFCPPMVVLFGRQAKAGEAGFTIDHSLENTEPWNEQLCTSSDEEQGALSPTPRFQHVGNRLRSLGSGSGLGQTE